MLCWVVCNIRSHFAKLQRLEAIPTFNASLWSSILLYFFPSPRLLTCVVATSSDNQSRSMPLRSRPPKPRWHRACPRVTVDCRPSVISGRMGSTIANKGNGLSLLISSAGHDNSADDKHLCTMRNNQPASMLQNQNDSTAPQCVGGGHHWHGGTTGRTRRRPGRVTTAAAMSW